MRQNFTITKLANIQWYVFFLFFFVRSFLFFVVVFFLSYNSFICCNTIQYATHLFFSVFFCFLFFVVFSWSFFFLFFNLLRFVTAKKKKSKLPFCRRLSSNFVLLGCFPFSFHNIILLQRNDSKSFFFFFFFWQHFLFFIFFFLQNKFDYIRWPSMIGTHIRSLH